MKTTRYALLTLALASVAPALHAQQRPQQLPPAVIVDTITNSVTVQNNRKATVTIYLETGKFARRLGTVPGQDTRTLPLPSWAVQGRATVRLFAHPDDEPTDLATQTLALTPPGRVGMVVPAKEARGPAPADTMMQVIPSEELAEATITVDNPRNVEVTVFAASGHFDVRLGTVAPASRATLRIPKLALNPFGSIQIFVHPQGGLDLQSQRMDVKAGDHLGLRVPPH